MKKIRLFNVIIGIFLLLFIGLINSGVVLAQQVSLSLSPPHLEALIKPGKSILIAYTLQNTGDPSVVSATVLPFSPGDEYGHITLKNQFEGPIRFSLDNSDIALGQPFFMQTKSSQQLLLKIRVPDGAPEGDYYYSFLATTEAPPTIEGIASSRGKVTIGTNILITVSKNGNTDANGKITTFDVVDGFKLHLFGKIFSIYDSSDAVPLLFLIQNSGSNMIKPQGEVTVSGRFGDTTTYDILPQNILASSQRRITATPSATLSCQDSQNERCIHPPSLVLKGFYIGDYKISTKLSFGEGSPVLTADTSFIAVPFRLIGAIIVILTLSILVIFKLKKQKS